MAPKQAAVKGSSTVHAGGARAQQAAQLLDKLLEVRASLVGGQLIQGSRVRLGLRPYGP